MPHRSAGGGGVGHYIDRRIMSVRSNRGTNGRKTGGLLGKCEISLHFCKSGRKTGGLLAKCEISLHFCK